jgi:penicillin-binding protein 2
MAGLGGKTGVDLPNERESTMPSTRWKMRNYRQKWYAGETISVAIGQGAVTTSPLELATAIGGLSLGGRWMKPHLLRAAKPSLIREVQFHQDNIHNVIDGMYGVVNEGGTGRFAALPNIRVCGKTGSAQLASNQFLKGTKLGQTLKDNGWFVAFAPEEAPEIVAVALFENGEHGDRASWIVRDVLKAYFDKKARASKGQAQLASVREPLLLPLVSPAAFLMGNGVR